jgi:hypothetical protein
MAKTGSTTTTFEKMGDNIGASVMNMSRGSRYTMSVAKKTEGRGSSPTGTTGKRSSTVIHEANGPKCHIDQTLYKANAADAGAQGRNVKIMKAAVGDTDFRSRSMYKQGV